MRFLGTLAILGGSLLLASGGAQARVNVDIGIGIPFAPVYAAPAPVYVAPPPVVMQPAPVVVAPAAGYYDPYWRERRWQEREWREREWREHKWREREWRRWRRGDDDD